MKKRLLAMLMVLLLVVSLMPVGALAANDASATSSNGYFDISYQNDGLYERTINVNLIINGSTIDTLTVSDAILGSQRVTISLNDPFSSKYDIENVITDGFDGAAPSLLADSYSVQVSNISSNDPAIINLHLIEYEDPEVSEVITGQGVTRTYRIYDDQVYKMLYSQGVDVTEETTVVSVTPLWVRSFGTESNKGLIHENLETDYWDNSFTSNSADVDEVQPTNIKGISITYDNGSGEETVTVSSGDLKFNVSGIAGSRYYVIELNDNSFHIVYFYNEEGALVGNAYTLYAIRFVNHGESLGSKMPSDPTYPATTYEFVGWTYGYDGGSPFLGTTPVNEDTVVYAQKTLSSNASEIHVMNNDDLLKERIQELYGEADIDWDSIKISVYAGTEHTNPDYNLSPYSNGWRDEDSYYFVYNYLTGAGQQENDSIYINDITHIAVTAKDTDGKDLGEVIINKGVYDGEFAVSTGSQGSSYIIELYIIDNGIQPPEPEPEPEEPRDPTDTELSKLAVVLECTNGEVEHAEKTKTFHMRTTNCDLEIQQFGEEYICTVAPDYEKILSTYNTATEATHEYEDGGKQFTLIWSANNNAWEVAGDASITRQVKCETPEPVKYAVNYHIVDANGNVIYNRTEYVSAGEYTDYDLWQPDEQAGCTFSGWFQKVEDLEKDHAEVTALYADKKWELYGRFTPDEPTDEWLQANVKIQVDCLQQSAHKNMDSWLIAGSYDEGTLSAREDGGWQYSFTVQAEKYLEAYAEKYGEHTANDSTRTVTLYFNDGKWENHNPSNNIYAVFDVKCVVPDAPTDVAGIFGDDSIVKIECITNKADHGDKYYQLKEGTYTVGDVEWRDGHWVLPITIKSGEYVAEFSYNHALTHTESKETEKTTHSVYWNGTQWTYDENDLPLVVFDTKCEGIDKPEQVESYDINVEVVNGTAEFKGTNIGANSVINVYPIENDNKNVTITFVPEDGFVFDAAYVGNEPVDLEDNSYTFGEVTADVTIKVLFKQDSTPVTPVIPLPTPGEISDLIKDEVVVDCVNDEMNHGDKAYGLLDDALVRIEKTDDTTVKVTLDATVYQAQYNTDTETKHDLADGQSATVTFALNYVDQTWRVAEGELPITIKVVCETPVEPEPTPDPAITGFSKTLVTDRNLYVYQGLAYPTFYRGSVIVDEGDGVTLLYKISVKGTAGTEFTVRDDSADFAQTGEIPDSGETSFYVGKTFTWRETRRADELTNTAAVLLDGAAADSDTETVDVDIDWDYNPPVVDDDEDEDDEVFVPNWLNTTDHFAYLIGYEDGEIKPENNITRAEVATIFFRLLTDDARARFWSSENDYTDVATDSWYNNAVSTLSNMGIINGYEDGTFQPNASITRAEFTAIATRFFDYTAEYEGAFNDVASGSWYADYVQAAVDMGLVDGYPDGGFHPNSYITRAEAVTIVNRVLNRVPHEDYLLSTRVMNTWPDNVYGAWYYADMQEATNSHDYDWIRVSGERVEEWTEKLTERDWAALEQEWSTAYSG